MSEYRIFQAQILAKDPVTPRKYSVVEIPNGQKLVGVQLGNALKDQSAPLLGSLVLVLQLDAYRSYILMVLREPFAVLSANNQYRGFIPSVGNVGQDLSNQANPIQDGEIFMEATGPTSPTGEVIPGFGAHLYLGNNGTAQIESGSTGERLVIGGTGSDDDHEVVLSADNGYIESNPNEGSQIQSTYNWDSLNNIEFGNVIGDSSSSTSITIPVAEMTIDALGNIELFNTTFGTGLKAASLVMDATGGLTLSSGTAGIPAAIIALTPDGFINLNNGVEPIARVGDSTFSSLVQDPAFWQFIQTLFITFNAHVHTSAAPGQPTSPPLTPLITFPTQMEGVISSGSPTIKAG